MVDARVETMAGKKVVLSDPRMVGGWADLLVVVKAVQLAVLWADWWEYLVEKLADLLVY